MAGRAGRGATPGRVIIQTYQPENPLLTTLIEEGYRAFARRELDTRVAAELPPHTPMALLRAEAVNGEEARHWLTVLARHLGPGLQVYGPAPALMPRGADRLRFQLMLTAANRADLHRALLPLKSIDEAPKSVRWSLDVDPYDTY